VSSKDPALYVRYALVSRLKALAVANMADRWYPQQIPANQPYPYGFVGVPIISPDGIQCLDSTTTRFAIHAYAEGETAANTIGQRVVELDGLHIDLAAAPILCPYPATLDLTWVSNTVVRDASESTIFHLISQWVAEVSA